MITLRPHQQKIVDENPLKLILAHGTRTGKTYTIAFWAQKRPETKFALFCPKRIKKNWISDLALCGTTNVTVFTKEEIKKVDLEQFTGLIGDEAHHVASGLFDKRKKVGNTNKRKFAPSDLTATIYNWVRLHPDYPILLATATPIASKPSNLHTLAALTGHYWDWKEYREYFYELVRRPYAPFPFWTPKENWRELIKPYARKVCDIVLLSDVINVPEQKHEVVKVSLDKETRQSIKLAADLSPSKEWHMKHQLAQGKEKLLKILELSESEAKVIVVCSYTAEIDYMLNTLEKHREVFVIDGRTKDPSTIIQKAAESEECFMIIQSSCGEGFRGDSFNMMIFSSMDWKVVSYQQMLGRMLHLNKQDGNIFYYLIADSKDLDIYERVVIAGESFSIAGIKSDN